MVRVHSRLPDPVGEQAPSGNAGCFFLGRDGTLAPGGSWTHRLPAADNTFAFVLDGELDANGQRAGAGDLVRTRADGDTLEFTAGDAGARFTLFAGPPLAQPRVLHGPFAARDTEQLARFVHHHASGPFGLLMPLSRT